MVRRAPFREYCVCPSPLMMAATATAAKRIRIGAAVWCCRSRPVRWCGEAAMSNRGYGGSRHRIRLQKYESTVRRSFGKGRDAMEMGIIERQARCEIRTAASISISALASQSARCSTDANLRNGSIRLRSAPAAGAYSIITALAAHTPARHAKQSMRNTRLACLEMQDARRPAICM